jgi:transketolase C-terminal domain/subunit
MEMVGIQDTFGESGLWEDLMTEYNVTWKDIVQACKKALGRKQK